MRVFTSASVIALLLPLGALTAQAPVDAKVAGRWQVATLGWSVEQAPACSKHPDGAPRP